MRLTKKERERVEAVTRTLIGIGDWKEHGKWAYYYSAKGIELGHIAEVDDIYRRPDQRVIAWSAAFGNTRMYFSTKAKAMQWVESTYHRKE